MRKQQSFQWNTLSMGVCYYPEQWDPALWRDDLRRMKEAGIGTIRIAEFAWSKVEPLEGEFTYDFFDGFLDIVEEEGMHVIWGTPTATPPAWLTEKYPEALNCRIDGVPYRHGLRRHYTYNSPKYRELCARIVEKIADHYAKRPCIVGWQIDNEINCETDEFYSESDTIAFRAFLKERYGSLDALNEAWGSVFWNQTYTDWDEIHVPRVTLHNTQNPHMMLDYSRFVSESAISFCGMQCDIIRKYLLKYERTDVFITTNGMFFRLDNHRMTDECLDVYTYDSYPNFANMLESDPSTDEMLRDRTWSMFLSEVRSVCPHFGIMEQQSGANGWTTRMEAPAPRPGQVMLWAMQSVAHGADYVSFFRWRTARFGTEMYWHGILDYDNRDNRKLAEVSRFGERLKKIQGLTGADYRASFALLKDYDNLWDADPDKWHRRLDEDEGEIFAAAQLTHTPYDVFYLRDETEAEELLKYPALFYPHALILTRPRADLLKAYVEAGGTLIIGARTGQKDLRGHCVAEPMPGLLRNVCGSEVREYTFASPAEDPVCMDWEGVLLEAGIFHDILEIREAGSDETGDDLTEACDRGTVVGETGSDVRVLASYKGSYYDGQPALIETKAGEGRVLHFGGTFTRRNVKAFLKYVGITEPFAGEITLPEECEIAVREKDGRRYFIVLNYMPGPRTITLREPMTDLDDGEEVCGDITLAPYGTKVYMV